MTDDIDRWLDEIGLAKYAGLFAANEIELATLPHLSESDLKELGMPMGPRKQLLAAIAELGRIDPDKAQAPVKEGDRRQLTVMFVDLVGSTALSTRLELEVLRGLINRYQSVVAAEVARYEGHVARFMGDGVLVYFGYPAAHEDSAERAVRAALAVGAAVGRETVAGERLEVRERPGDQRLGFVLGVVFVESIRPVDHRPHLMVAVGLELGQELLVGHLFRFFAAANAAQCRVDGEPVEPGGELRIALEHMDFAKGGEKYILNHFFGVRSIAAENAQRHVVKFG